MVFHARAGARKLVLAAMFLLFLLPSAVHARGQQEDALTRADVLISERKYNEAILTLTSFIKEQPTRFDDAQKRLQRIVRLRDEYNVVASELLDVLVNDPTNDARKLAMLRRLEELENAPNRSAREFLLKTKETALFTYNRAQFERIMGEGRKLLDQAQYVSAARKYTDGFSLYRPEFYSAGYGDIIVNRVDRGVSSVDSLILSFGNLIPSLEEAISRFEAAFAGSDLKTAEGAYANLEAVLLEYAGIRNNLARTGRSFEDQFLLLQGADKTLGENSFLPFAYRLILGRRTEIRPEGVLGAMDTLWIAQANRAQAAAAGAVDRAFLAARNQVTSGDHRSAIALFENVSRWALLGERTLSFWSAVAGSEVSPALTQYGRSIVTGKVPVFLKYQALANVVPFMGAAEGYRIELDAKLADATARATSYREKRMLEAAFREGGAQHRAFLKNLVSRVDAESENLRREGGREQGLERAALLGKDVAAYRLLADEYLAAVRAAALAADTDAALIQYQVVVERMEENLGNDQSSLAKARALLEGSPSPDGNALYRYPKESIPLLEAASTSSREALSLGASLIAEIRGEHEVVSGDERVMELVRKSKVLTSTLVILEGDAGKELAEARRRVDQAQSARLEADRLYAEARSALGSLNFDRARDRIQKSGERYDFSLSVQESVSLRTERDQKLLELSSEITKTENESVVRDVRRFIREAKTSYFDGAFDRSEEYLIQAQNRWKTTNVAEEPEVEYWIKLVRSALSIKTGRTIPVTAPLYPEMSQLLSFARKAYDEGKSLLEQRRRVDALKRFDEARQKIQEVKIVFPLNQEASLLSLRIEQLTEPDVFSRNFARKIAEAQAKVRDKPQEAYSELQDLAEINPAFPGLKATIERVEIAIGLRLPPPDRVALARSEDLVRSAARIIGANLRGQFPIALEQLNKALELNPNNEQAVTLKDKIGPELGGTVSIVLTAAQEKEYQKAVLELQTGNTIVAQAIVEQLLRDPKARNSPRILELQKRIKSRL